MFLGADVVGLEQVAKTCRDAASFAQTVRNVLRAIVAAASIFGPWGKAFIAYLEHVVIPWLEQVIAALTAFAKVLSGNAEAQRRVSAGETVNLPPPPTYQTPALPAGDTQQYPVLPPASGVLATPSPAWRPQPALTDETAFSGTTFSGTTSSGDGGLILAQASGTDQRPWATIVDRDGTILQEVRPGEDAYAPPGSTIRLHPDGPGIDTEWEVDGDRLRGRTLEGHDVPGFELQGPAGSGGSIYWGPTSGLDDDRLGGLAYAADLDVWDEFRAGTTSVDPGSDPAAGVGPTRLTVLPLFRDDMIDTDKLPERPPAPGSRGGDPTSQRAQEHFTSAFLPRPVTPVRPLRLLAHD